MMRFRVVKSLLSVASSVSLNSPNCLLSRCTLDFPGSTRYRVRRARRHSQQSIEPSIPSVHRFASTIRQSVRSCEAVSEGGRLPAQLSPLSSDSCIILHKQSSRTQGFVALLHKNANDASGDPFRGQCQPLSCCPHLEDNIVCEVTNSKKGLGQGHIVEYLLRVANRLGRTKIGYNMERQNSMLHKLSIYSLQHLQRTLITYIANSPQLRR